MTAQSFEGTRSQTAQPTPMSRGSSRRGLWTSAVIVTTTAAIAAGSWTTLSDTRAVKNLMARAGLSGIVGHQQDGREPIRLASLGGHAGLLSAEDDRGTRLSFESSRFGGEIQKAGSNLAERGGRVFHAEPQVAKAAASLDQDVLVAALGTPRPESASSILRALPKEMKAKVAAEKLPAKAGPANANAKPQIQGQSQGALAMLAAFDPKPSVRTGLGNTAVAAYQSVPDVPRPSMRPEIDASIGTEIAAEAAEPATDAVMAAVTASVPVPAMRPETPLGKEIQVASLEPGDTPGLIGNVTDEMTALAVPLPERRPSYSPPVVASIQQPQPQPAPQQPAQRQAPQPAPAVANTRTGIPGQDSDRGGGSFFQRLFRGGSSAKLPPAHLGVAVYDISAQTVYLPGDGKLEAHSGLGHMQDNPRYVAQKMRGPTPPNVYNLRMREARFHGVEAIRLLPADGRKKYNRDGLLTHSYMYIGGGDRSQSNGCIVFKNYDRFLAAFKRGQVKKMIVVPSMDELPTYMAAL